MTLFEPSTLLAVFPYVFISAFPIFGIVLVTWWIIKDRKSSSSISISYKKNKNKNKNKNNFQ
jgi:Na+/H+ antiporter NhaC